MGLFGRVKSTVGAALRTGRELARAVKDEGQYPGRPPPHVASSHPLWRDPDTVRPAAPAAASPSAVSPAAAPPATASPPPAAAVPPPTDSRDRNAEPFWFLKDGEDVDGWDQTDARPAPPAKPAGDR